MSSRAFIGPALLTRLVAEEVNKPIEEVAGVLAAYDKVVHALLSQGTRVRALGVGYFEVIKTKASRRRSPMLAGRFVKVPAKKKIVFRESRKK